MVTSMVRATVFLALLGGVLGLPEAAGAWHAYVGNQGQLFRLPWLEGGINSASRGPSNCYNGWCHGPGAVDFLVLDPLSGIVKVIGDGIVLRRELHWCFGNVVEIEHAVGGSSYNYRSQYAHLASLPSFMEGQQVQQGKIIASAGTTGSCRVGGPHLHFDMCPVASTCSSATSVAWPEMISQTSAGMWSSTSHTGKSNNPGAAYWGTGGANEAPAWRDAYFAVGGWQYRGSASRMETTWEICNGSGGSRIIWGCPSQFGDIHFQTFRGTPGNWRSAMVNAYRNNTDGPVYWITRGLFGPYTYQYSPSTVWSYLMGAPMSTEYLWYGLLRQDYEGGYTSVLNESGCVVVVYRNWVQQLQITDPNRACSGGEGPGQGYGSDGD
ncbi:MAG TPA: M23 family metallopeptidase [Dehalococcoidia bacterium]|nr:M23 family metallopeptidase [Dehalococcoidia bacterium]